MYTARLICVFEIDVLCHGYKPNKCRLAYIQYLDVCPNNPKSTIDKLQDSDRVVGEDPSKRQQYEVIEYDRILGAEYLIPCFEDPVTMESYRARIASGKDIRQVPLSDKEVWRRVIFGRRVGSAHATPGVMWMTLENTFTRINRGSVHGFC